MNLGLAVHLSLAALLGLGFLSTQVVCVILYNRWLDSQLSELNQIEISVPDDSGAVSSRASNWTSWVRTHFPEGVKAHGNFARDDAFQELNWRLSTCLPLSWLHRMGVMAPLLGVMITAFGFIGLELPELEKSGTAELVSAIRPVVVGILLGGGLSIFNQFCLQFAEHRSDAFRERARCWFDDEIWPKVVTREESTNRAAAECLIQAAAEMRGFATKHRLNADAAVQSTRVIERAAGAIGLAVSKVSTEWMSSIEKLSGLGKEVSSATRQLQATIPGAREITESLVKSVGVFGEIVEKRFTERVQLQDEASRRLSESATAIANVVEGIATGSQSLMRQCDLQRAAAEEFLMTFNDTVVPNQARMVTTTDELKNTVEQLDGRLRQLENAVRVATEGLTVAAPGLSRVVGLVEESMQAFRSVIDGDLTSAAKGHCESVKGWSESRLATDSLIVEFGRTAGTLETILGEFSHASAAIRESVEINMGPSTNLLHQSATTLLASSERLATGIEGAKDSLDQTSKTLTELIRRATQTLDHIKPPIDQFYGLVIDQLAPANESRRAATEAAANSLEVFQASADNLRIATDGFNQLISRQAELVERSRTSADSLRNATEGIGVIISDTRTQLEKQFRDVHGGLGQLCLLIEDLRSIAVSGTGVVGIVNSLKTNIDALSEQIDSMKLRMEEIAQRSPKRGLFG